MSTQPEPLRLADALHDGTYLLSQEHTATEAALRRLHAECERLRALTVCGCGDQFTAHDRFEVSLVIVALACAVASDLRSRGVPTINPFALAKRFGFLDNEPLAST